MKGNCYKSVIFYIFIATMDIGICASYQLQKPTPLTTLILTLENQVGFFESIIVFPSFAMNIQLNIIYSKKATKFCEISTNYLSYVLPVK